MIPGQVEFAGFVPFRAAHDEADMRVDRQRVKESKAPRGDVTIDFGPNEATFLKTIQSAFS
jgi:hypothetical protein